MKNLTNVKDFDVVGLGNDRGLTVELAKTDKAYVLKIWQMYTDNDGDWAYCSANGGRGIVLYLNDLTVVDYLLKAVKESFDIMSKSPIVASVATSTGKKKSSKTSTTPAPAKSSEKVVDKVSSNIDDIVLTPELANALLQKFMTSSPAETKQKKSNKK